MDKIFDDGSDDKISKEKSTVVQRLEKIVYSLENSKRSVVYTVLTLFFIITIRILLDGLLQPRFYDSTHFFDYDTVVFNYTSLFVSILAPISLLNLLLEKPIEKIIKTVTPFVLFIGLSPIIDYVLWILFDKPGLELFYLNVPYSEVLVRYLTFFGKFDTYLTGVSIGMKIEIMIFMILIGIYIYLSTKNVLKSVFGSWMLYNIIFLIGIVPILFRAFTDLTGFYFSIAVKDLTIVYSWVILLLMFSVIYSKKKEQVKSIMYDIRPFRITHFNLMFILGIVFGMDVSAGSIGINILQVISVSVSITLACLFALFLNNIVDIEIDKISNANRPLVAGDITIDNYAKLSWVLFFLAISYSLLINNLIVTLVIISFMGNYFIYSAEPLRLKRIPFFSKFIISFNSFLFVLLGYRLTYGSLKNFPIEITLLILLGFTAVINFIDIKDYEGDKKERIKTLPVLLGLKRSKLLIGSFFMITFISVYFIFDELLLLIPLSIVGMIEFYLVNRKNYDERPVFLVYLLGLVGLIILDLLLL